MSDKKRNESVQELVGNEWNTLQQAGWGNYLMIDDKVWFPAPEWLEDRMYDIHAGNQIIIGCRVQCSLQTVRTEAGSGSVTTASYVAEPTRQSQTGAGKLKVVLSEGNRIRLHRPQDTKHESHD